MLLTDFPYKLGDTADSGEQEHLLGREVWFPYLDPDTSAPRSQSSGMFVRARWVKNEAAGIVYPGFIHQWDIGATYGPGRAVGAVAIADTDLGIGVVDPFISAAGVADNRHFFIIERGPCKFRFTTGTTIAVGDTLALGGAGRVIKYAAMTETAIGERDRCGLVLEAVDTAIASDVMFDGYADFKF